MADPPLLMVLVGLTRIRLGLVQKTFQTSDCRLVGRSEMVNRHSALASRLNELNLLKPDVAKPT